MTKSLFLLTEYDITEYTLNKINETKNPIIFPLTYQAYKILENKSIKCMYDDMFLTPQDYELIDNTVYHLSRHWCEQDNLKSIFDHYGINKITITK